MNLKYILSLVVLINLFCDVPEEKSKEIRADEIKNEVSLDGFNEACTTITDEVTIKVLTKEKYNKDSVFIKVMFDNMMAKNYLVCRDMMLNFPLYPIINPTVEIKNVTDSMNYLFDTLGPGESIIKEFNFSRYCSFKPGKYNVQFLFTANASEYKTEKLRGLKLSSFSLNIKESL